MKTFKRLVESLPPKTVVFAFGRFSPPTVGHLLLVQFVKKLAQHNKADHVIYASRTQDKKKNPLPLDRKLHFLNLMFPGTNFVGASDQVRTFIEAAKLLNRRYKNLIMVAGSDRVPEYTKILQKYNGVEYNFDSIQVMSAGERDPDADDASGMSASKLRAVAAKGDFQQFRKGLPTSFREIDARRLMDDVREGMGLEVVKEQIKLTVDTLREKYFRKEIYNVGDIVESITGEQYQILKRGTNHLVVQDSDGITATKWIHEVIQGKPHEDG
jgi:hypothetical protein